MDETSDGIWYAEHDSADGTHYYSVRSILFDGQTAHHDVKILVTEEWGKTLILDGGIQSTEFDEAIVHEALVHPAMIAHSDPKKVLILGNDDGAVLREVLGYKSVEKVTMADVDEEYLDICAEFLPEWSVGSLDLPIVDYEFEDSWDFLEHTDQAFDVVLADLSSYEEEDSDVDLAKDDFYRLLNARMSENGIIVIHGLDFDMLEPRPYAAIRSAIAKVFPVVTNYTAHVPSFRGETMVMMASKGTNPTTLTHSEITKRLGERGANTDNDIGSTLRFYDADTHMRMFSLPKNLKSALGEVKTTNGSGS